MESLPIYKSGSGSTHIRLYTPTEIVLEVSSNENQFMFISDTYDYGWKAEINGQSAELYKATYTFRGVNVPAGNSTVRLYYYPDSFRWGKMMSILGLGLLCCYAAISTKKLFKFRK